MSEPPKHPEAIDLARLRPALERRLAELEHGAVVVETLRPIAEDRAEGELKHVGYGQPLLVRYRVDGAPRSIVFRTQGANWFGHDRRADRAALAVLAADTYGELPDHVRVLDLGAIRDDGGLASLADTGEVYLLTSYLEGELYARDLRRIERSGRATELDVERARALARWLARLHGDTVEPLPELYQRQLRDLVGSGEGIFGIVDSYPDGGPVPRARLEAIEHRCVTWRHRLRGRFLRLRRTHGDFHPYNVLFREGTDFSLLDASRGGRGEPADDVAAMSINYLFGGALAPTAWPDGLRPLWRAFWAAYLEDSGDWEILEVIAPFLAWRLLVVASPVWYPAVPEVTRDALLRVAEQALDAAAFDPEVAERTLLAATG